MSAAHWRTMTLFVSAALLISTRAHAELGGSAASVQADSDHMGARVKSTMMTNYARHEITRVNGGMVHELTNASGQVFAVTWSGPGKPDLRALLGSRFSAFQSANAPLGPASHALRRPPQLNQADLMIQTGGHMGWFRGVAFIPSLAPATFSVSELREAP